MISKNAKSRQVLHTFLYIALLAAGVFAAWQIRMWWLGRQRPQGQAQVEIHRAAPDRDRPGAVGAVLTGSRPAELTGMEEIAADPDGIAPPEGATRLRTFRRTMGREQIVTARYDYRGTTDAAATYYSRILRERGYRLLSDGAPAAASRPVAGDELRSLVFDRPPQYVTLHLEKRLSRGEAVSIVLVLTCPAGPATAPAEAG